MPFFGEKTLDTMNQESEVADFMSQIADRQFSDWVAKKAFTYVKSIIDTAQNLGVVKTNAARLIPKHRRIPKGVVRKVSQPFISIHQFVRLHPHIERSRDKIILRLLFLCAPRRGELFVFKWKDLQVNDGMTVLKVRRSFDSRTHKVHEWDGRQKAHGEIAIPSGLAADLEGWRKFGGTNGNDPESYIFPTRNGTCIIPTNWAEDVLKPAGAKAGIPNVSYHWFRRGYATVQHHGKVQDKAIQAQMRHANPELTRNVYMRHVDPETWNAVVDLEKRIDERRDVIAVAAAGR